MKKKKNYLSNCIRRSLIIPLLLLLSNNVVQVLAQNSNIAKTSTGVFVATQGTRGGLLTRTSSGNIPQTLEFPLPSVASLDDVAIDPQNENLVFALSTNIPARLCSYTLNQLVGDLTLVNCVESGFNVAPFSGVSANGGTVLISGGTGGFTVFDYDTNSGKIANLPGIQNFEFPGVVGHPDVVMIDEDTAALSTDFASGVSFGTQIASVAGSTPTALQDYRVPNSIGFDLIAGSTNFPLVNALLTVGSTTYMYTANGAMTVQDLNGQEVDTIVGGPGGFEAVTVATNPQQGWIVFGGVVNGFTSQIVVFTIDGASPTNPTLVTTAPVSGRITSVASSNSVIGYVTQTGTEINLLTMGNSPSQPTGIPPTPTPPGFPPSPTPPTGGSPPDGSGAMSRHSTWVQAFSLGIGALAWLAL